MDVSKEEVFILNKYDPFDGENRIKGIYKSNTKARNFKRYLENRNKIKQTKNENFSTYTIERSRIYIDLTG